MSKPAFLEEQRDKTWNIRKEVKANWGATKPREQKSLGFTLSFLSHSGLHLCLLSLGSIGRSAKDESVVIISFETLTSWGSYKETMLYVRHLWRQRKCKARKEWLCMWGRVEVRRQERDCRNSNKTWHQGRCLQEGVLIIHVREGKKFRSGEASWFIIHGTALLFSHFLKIPHVFVSLQSSCLFIKNRYCLPDIAG